jgi:prevent-host-death family protein
MRMGLREANQHFSKAVKVVKAGEEVILTERGKPIAVIKPLNGAAKSDAVIQRLEASVVLRPASKPSPLPPWAPRPLKGKPLSRTLREERDVS